MDGKAQDLNNSDTRQLWRPHKPDGVRMIEGQTGTQASVRRAPLTITCIRKPFTERLVLHTNI